MFKLKIISKDSIPHALEKAERYRLLNEPGQAESICQDVLAVDPQNQKALVALILALSDRFTRGFSVSGTQPDTLISRLTSEYDKAYYSGLILERRAKAMLDQGGPPSNFMAFNLFHEAMKLYENAESLRQPGNDDAALRWNTCARIIMQNNLRPKSDDEAEQFLE